MSSATPRPRFAKIVVALAALAMLATACGASTTQITDSSATDSSTDSTTSSGAADPTAPPAAEPTAEPVEPPTAEPEPEPTTAPPPPTAVEEVPTEVPVAAERIIPSGWEDYDLGTFQAALPGDWTGLTTGDDIDQMLDSATQNSDPVLAAQLEQYRDLVNGGNALIGLGANGDNFNAFRQPGSAIAFTNTDAVVRQLEQQLSTFADDVQVDATLDAINGRDGLRTTGSYVLEGQQVFLYQFATEVDGFLYYFTSTLFTGDDPALAEQIFLGVGIG